MEIDPQIPSYQTLPKDIEQLVKIELGEPVSRMPFRILDGSRKCGYTMYTKYVDPELK